MTFTSFLNHTHFTKEVTDKLMEESDKSRQFEHTDDSVVRESAKVTHPKSDCVKEILLLATRT